MYAWLVTLHLLGLVLFLVSHAVGMWVAFQVRSSRDREVIRTLLAMSVRGSRLMYLGLLALGAGGLGAAATADLLLAPWNVASYVVLATVMVAMYAVAGSYYFGLRDAVVGTPRTPRLDDEALSTRLQTRRPEILAVIGGGGLVALVWLMAVKPALW